MTIITDDTDRLILTNYNADGVQPKYRDGDVWHKLDDFGYEGLAETVTSNILEHSNFSNYAKYTEENYLYKGKLIHGCKSDNFREDSDKLVTADKLFHAHYGTAVGSICRGDSPKETIFNFVAETSKITNIDEQELGEHITAMLELDALIVNGDRHYNNIAFLEHEDGSYDLAPLFDHGEAFFSNECMYHGDMEVAEMMEICKSRTFCDDFSVQMKAAEELYGKQLVLDFKTIDEVMPQNSIYPKEQLERVKETLEIQMEKYAELFQEKEQIQENKKDSRELLRMSLDERIESIKRMQSMIPAMDLLNKAREQQNRQQER